MISLEVSLCVSEGRICPRIHKFKKKKKGVNRGLKSVSVSAVLDEFLLRLLGE